MYYCVSGAYVIIFLILKDSTLCLLENDAFTEWPAKASSRLHLAFRPKTYRAYTTMFRAFVEFLYSPNHALRMQMSK